MAFSEELFTLLGQYLHNKIGTEIRLLKSNSTDRTFTYTKELNCRLRHCTVNYTCRNDGLAISAYCPVKATPDSFASIAQYLNELNVKSHHGTSFSLNYSDGSIVADQFLRLTNLNAFTELTISAFSWPVQELERYSEELIRLLEG